MPSLKAREAVLKCPWLNVSQCSAVASWGLRPLFSVILLKRRHKTQAALRDARISDWLG